MKRWILISISMLAVASCGDSGSGDVDGPGGIDGPPGGGDGPHSDGALPQGCAPGTPAGDTECSDCIDNDNDGEIDGYDVECTGAADDDESSFATGIPGDNMDPKHQDCFFDGNSGAGDDGCRFHTCCILGVPAGGCAIDANFDPVADCPPQTAECIEMCGALTPPGCDCFGCCHVCDPATNECRDIVTNPAIAPDCDEDHILDPVACPACTPNTECGTPCDPANCILCPGQDPNDLPPACTGAECPGGAQECMTMPCPGSSYCSNGCCISVID